MVRVSLRSRLLLPVFEGTRDGLNYLMSGEERRETVSSRSRIGPRRVWIRWSHFGVNKETGEPLIEAEDFGPTPMD
jgi:hypothetical protein